MDYKNAGVDIEAGYKSVELMKQHIAKTMRPEVLGGIGGFSGAFSMNSFKDMEEPTLVSGTDGVGTKLKLAFIMDKHDTVGIDCVAMCVNDIACAGGEPLFFLDYIACGKNYPEKIAEIVKGVAEGCSQSSAALIGGETAEMPGFYPVDEYDLAGFAVGVVDKKDLITGENLNTGDVLRLRRRGRGRRHSACHGGAHALPVPAAGRAARPRRARQQRAGAALAAGRGGIALERGDRRAAPRAVLRSIFKNACMTAYSAAALNAGAAAFFAYLSRFCAYHRKKSVSRVNFIQKEG